MKFGKKFKDDVIPEWKTQYLDYKLLKKIIKRIKKSNRETLLTHSLQENEFTIAIEQELKKINDFYVVTERRFAERHAQLVQQIRAFVTRIVINALICLVVCSRISK